MIRNCNNCTKEYEAPTSRSKFCSEKCKLAAFRNNKSSVPLQSTVTNDTQTPENVTETKLTKTDQLFQDDVIAREVGKEHPGGSESWLAFTDTIRQPECKQCGKKFKTRLPLLQFCSPVCRRNAWPV